MTTVIFVLDVTTSKGWADWVLYLVPLFVLSSSVRERFLLMLAAAYSLLIVLGFVVPSHVHSNMWIGVLNRGLGILVVWFAAILLARRKQAEALLAFEANLLANVSDAVVSVNERRRVTSWNRAAEAMYGWKAHEVIGRRTAEVFRTDPNDMGAAAVMRTLRRTGQWSGTLTQPHRDGTPIRVEAKAIALRENTGRISGFVSVNRDVTARERAAQALRRSEEQTRSLLAVAQCISGTLDQDELLERVQRQAASVLECDMVVTFRRDHAARTSRIAAHHGLQEDVLPQALALEFKSHTELGRRLLAGESLVFSDVGELLGVDRQIVEHFGVAALVAAPLRVRGRHYGTLVAARRRGGRPFQADELELCKGIARQLGVAMEAAELYQAQREEAEISSALARVGQELISSLDTPRLLDRLCHLTAEALECDASYILLSQPAERTYAVSARYGVPDEQWESLRILRIPAEAFSGLLTALRRAGLVQIDTQVPPTPWAALPAQYGLTRVLYVPLRRGEEIIGILGAGFRGRPESFPRVRERIARGLAHLASLALEDARLFEDLARANRLKSDFVATMSHELRTPMNIIMGYNDLLLDELFGPLNAEQASALRSMDKSSRQLLELINATLDLSRLEVGRLPLQLSDINMPDLIRDLRDETRPLQDKPGISVAWEAEPTLPSLRTDPGKVKIIIKNLVDNAVKFTEKGTVVVAASAREGGVEVRVTDPGIGIAPDALAVIFEPFRQLETSMTRTYGGVGLGLYLVRRLLDLLGGTIAVETEVGKGSTFRVWLKDQRGDHESTEFSGAGRPTRLVPRSIRAATAA